MSKREGLYLLVLIVAGIAVRLVFFGDIPHGINRDEAALGYNAYLISQTGKDEFGRSLPLQIESFGDWKLPGYVYSLIPIVGLFGLSPVTVRLPALMAGILLLVGLYLMVRDSIQAKKYAMAAGLMTVFMGIVTPWHFHFSRVAYEAMLAASLVVWGVWLMMKQRQYAFLAGSGLLLLSLFTYHAAHVFVFFISITVLIVCRSLSRKWWYRVGALIIASGLLFQGYQTLYSNEQVKAQGLLITDLSEQQQFDLIYSKRTGELSKLIHNAPVYYAGTLIKNYGRVFSPEFLVFEGGEHPNHDIPGFGNFLLITVALAIIGVVGLIKLRSGWSIVYGVWLLVAPLAAAVTVLPSHSTRSILLLPIVLILSGIGYGWLLEKTKWKQLATGIIVGLVLLQFIPFIRYYFSDYRAYSDLTFSGYMHDIAHNMYSEKDNYRLLVTTNYRESPYIFYAFYNQLGANDFFSTIERFPPDDEGFVFVERLDTLDSRDIDYPSLIQPKEHPPNDLVYSRPDTVPDWIVPYLKWDNLQGELEMIAWRLGDIR